MVTVFIDYGGFPKGTPVAIKDLGLIPNATSVELSAERVAAFENKVGVAISDYYKTSSQVTVTHTKEKITSETKTIKEVTK